MKFISTKPFTLLEYYIYMNMEDTSIIDINHSMNTLYQVLAELLNPQDLKTSS